MMINNQEVKRINRGEFSICYRSVTNPAIVYYLVRKNTPDKEIYAHVGESLHIPRMVSHGEMYHRSDFYDIYESDYSETLTNRYPSLVRIANNMQSITRSNRMRNYRTLRYDADYANLASNTVELMRESDIPATICDDLDLLLSWGMNYNGKLHMEFNCANLAVKDNVIILRDVIFFPYMNK